MPSRLDSVQALIRESSKDVLMNGLPPRVRQVMAQLVAQIGDELQVILCGGNQCDDDTRAEMQAKMIRRMSTKEFKTSNGIIGGGLKGLFSQIFGAGR